MQPTHLTCIMRTAKHILHAFHALGDTSPEHSQRRPSPTTRPTGMREQGRRLSTTPRIHGAARAPPGCGSEAGGQVPRHASTAPPELHHSAHQDAGARPAVKYHATRPRRRPSPTTRPTGMQERGRRSGTTPRVHGAAHSADRDAGARPTDERHATRPQRRPSPTTLPTGMRERGRRSSTTPRVHSAAHSAHWDAGARPAVEHHATRPQCRPLGPLGCGSEAGGQVPRHASTAPPEPHYSADRNAGARPAVGHHATRPQRRPLGRPECGSEADG